MIPRRRCLSPPPPPGRALCVQCRCPIDSIQYCPETGALHTLNHAALLRHGDDDADASTDEPGAEDDDPHEFAELFDAQGLRVVAAPRPYLAPSAVDAFVTPARGAAAAAAGPTPSPQPDAAHCPVLPDFSSSPQTAWATPMVPVLAATTPCCASPAPAAGAPVLPVGEPGAAGCVAASPPYTAYPSLPVPLFPSAPEEAPPPPPPPRVPEIPLFPAPSGEPAPPAEAEVEAASEASQSSDEAVPVPKRRRVRVFKFAPPPGSARKTEAPAASASPPRAPFNAPPPPTRSLAEELDMHWHPRIGQVVQGRGETSPAGAPRRGDERHPAALASLAAVAAADATALTPLVTASPRAAAAVGPTLSQELAALAAPHPVLLDRDVPQVHMIEQLADTTERVGFACGAEDARPPAAVEMSPEEVDAVLKGHGHATTLTALAGLAVRCGGGRGQGAVSAHAVLALLRYKLKGRRAGHLEGRPASVLVKPRIRTGCEELDHRLRGGVAAGEVTEFVGGIGAGKTLLAHLCAASCIAHGGRVAWVHAGGGLSLAVVEQLVHHPAIRRAPGPGLRKEALRELVPEVADPHDFLACAAAAAEFAAGCAGTGADGAPRLLVVDDITSLIHGSTGLGKAPITAAALQAARRVLIAAAAREGIAVVICTGVLDAYNPADTRPHLPPAWAALPATSLHLAPAGASQPPAAALGHAVAVTLLKSPRLADFVLPNALLPV